MQRIASIPLMADCSPRPQAWTPTPLSPTLARSSVQSPQKPLRSHPAVERSDRCTTPCCTRGGRPGCPGSRRRTSRSHHSGSLEGRTRQLSRREGAVYTYVRRQPADSQTKRPAISVVCRFLAPCIPRAIPVGAVPRQTAGYRSRPTAARLARESRVIALFARLIGSVVLALPCRRLAPPLVGAVVANRHPARDCHYPVQQLDRAP